MTARIVLDLDGPLIDSAPDVQNIANAALAGVDAAPITLADTHTFIGEGIHIFVARMRDARNLPERFQEPLLKDLIARYDDAFTLTELYPGVRAALTALSQTHRLGICTNKLHRPCIRVLRHLRIDHFFASVWGGDNPIARKPDPAPLRAVFEELGSGPRIYVGDSEIDAETAQRAGVPFVLFTGGYRKSDVDQIPHSVALDDFHDLLTKIGPILAQAQTRSGT